MKPLIFGIIAYFAISFIGDAIISGTFDPRAMINKNTIFGAWIALSALGILIYVIEKAMDNEK